MQENTKGCCSVDKDSGCGCEKKAICSPCLFIWAAALVAVLAFYLAR